MKIVSSNSGVIKAASLATLKTYNEDGTYKINGKGKWRTVDWLEQIVNDIDDPDTWTPEFIEANGLHNVVTI